MGRRKKEREGGREGRREGWRKLERKKIRKKRKEDILSINAFQQTRQIAIHSYHGKVLSIQAIKN